MAKLVICASGIGAAHGVGVDHRQSGHRGYQKRLEGVAAADFDRHHRGEAAAEILFHHPHRLGGEGGIGQPFLPDQRRSHVGDDGDQSVIVEIGGVHQVYPDAIGVELAHVEVGEVRRPATPGSEDPGTGRQRLQFV